MFRVQLLSTPKAAEYMGLSHRTLETWRRDGKGPRYRKVGRLVRYDPTDLDAFLDSVYVETPDSIGLVKGVGHER